MTAAGIRVEIPEPGAWGERLDAVLATLEIAYAQAYEDAAGASDPSNGVTQITIGTGGEGHHTFSTVRSTSVVVSIELRLPSARRSSSSTPETRSYPAGSLERMSTSSFG